MISLLFLFEISMNKSALRFYIFYYPYSTLTYLLILLYMNNNYYASRSSFVPTRMIITFSCESSRASCTQLSTLSNDSFLQYNYITVTYWYYKWWIRLLHFYKMNELWIWMSLVLPWYTFNELLPYPKSKAQNPFC